MLIQVKKIKKNANFIFNQLKKQQKIQKEFSLFLNNKKKNLKFFSLLQQIR